MSAPRERTTIPDPMLTQLQQAQHIAVITGAGISAESGIPTFRDAQQGLWAQYDPSRLATPEAFLENPALVWDWYSWRRQLITDCQPNAGHLALARLATLVPRLTLITQNVDGLHQAAGSTNVVELHGNIKRVKCFDHEHLVDQWDETEKPPHCPTCGSMLRPDVVWFGEMLPQRALEEASAAANECDVFFSIGTSGQVYPAADLAYQALRKRTLVVEVNAEPTPLTNHANLVLSGKAGERLPELLEIVWNQRL